MLAAIVFGGAAYQGRMIAAAPAMLVVMAVMLFVIQFSDDGPREGPPSWPTPNVQ